MTGVNFSAMTPQQMYQMYGAGQTGYSPYAGGNSIPMKMQGQLDQDVYQPSSGIGLGGIATTAVAGGVTGGAAGYWWLNNPVTKGENGVSEVNPDIYKNYDNYTLKTNINEAIKQAEISAMSPFGVTSHEQYEALKKLANVDSIDKLPAEVQGKLGGITNDPAVAKSKVDNIKTALDGLDRTKIATDTFEKVQPNLVAEKFEFLKNYDGVKANLDKLGAGATEEQLEQFILNNKKMFNLTGKTDAEVAKEIARSGYGGVLSKLEGLKSTYEPVVSGVKSKILGAVDSEGKLLSTLGDDMKAILGDFKLSQAKKLGKWGAAIGGGLAFIYSLFA